MDATLQCPSCRAHLTLPALPTGETVECPRCRQTFEMFRQNTNALVSAVPIMDVELDRSRTVPDERPEHDSYYDRLVKIVAFRGKNSAVFAMVMLAVGVLCCSLQVYVEIETTLIAQRRIEVGPGPFRGRRPQPPQFVELQRRESNLMEVTDLANVAQIIVSCIAFCCFLAWLHQAFANCTRLLRSEGMNFNSALAVLYCLIPGLNLFCPYLIVQELWRASHPKAIANGTRWKVTPRLLLIAWWWLLCLAGWTLIFYGKQAVRTLEVQDQWKTARYVGAGQACLLIAGVLLIVIIHRITRRQRERYINLYEA